jgi:hypothetical protein
MILRNPFHLRIYLLFHLASILRHYSLVSPCELREGILSVIVVFDFGQDVEPYVHD